MNETTKVKEPLPTGDIQFVNTTTGTSVLLPTDITSLQQQVAELTRRIEALEKPMAGITSENLQQITRRANRPFQKVIKEGG